MWDNNLMAASPDSLILDPMHCAHITIRADPMAVREGLRALFDTMILRGLPDANRGTAEIVLAEALNNIVEHAYACHSGDIEITLRLCPDALMCKITDTGLPMPDEKLPQGKLAAISATDDLPEGGFGWFLIRTLSQDLRYQREAGRNLLSFRLETGPSQH